MRALRQHSWNGPEDLRLVDVEPPTPGPGEILVRVAAAGVNFADVMQTYGTYGGGPRPPYLAGFEAAGEVVDGPAAGATVVGTGYGAFAEYMTMPAAAAAPVPAGWTGEQALGLVLNWATALAALRTLGRLAPGETVLVHAAAGGVGQAAVRLARHYGATVLGIASPAKHAAVRAAGADDVLDPSADLAAEARRRTGGRGADLVLESVGGPAFAASLAAARRITGRVVVLGEAGGEAAVTNRRLVFDDQVQVMGLHIGVLARAEPELYAGLLDELRALAAAGVYPPGRPTVYDLADGPRALADLRDRLTVGKLALRP